METITDPGSPQQRTRVTTNVHLSPSTLKGAAVEAGDTVKWVALGPLTLFADDWHELGETLIRLGHAALIEADSAEQDRADAETRRELERMRGAHGIEQARQSLQDGLAGQAAR